MKLHIQRIFFLLFLLITFCESKAQQNRIPGIPSGLYSQEIQKDIQLPGGSSQNILRLIKQANRTIAFSANQMFVFELNKWSQRPLPVQGNFQTAAMDTKGKLWMIISGSLINFDGSNRISLPFLTQKDTVFSLFLENETTVYIGTNKGLYSNNGTSWDLVKITANKKVNQIAAGKGELLWVATSDGLFKRDKGQWVNMNERVIAPGIRRNFLCLSNGPSSGDLLFGTPFVVAKIAEDGNHWAYTKADGLPYGPITAIRNSGNNIWIATPDGAILKNDRWHYYHGKTWLPDNQINDILVCDPNTVWLATPKGISQIQQVQMSLVQKSERFEQRLNQRHLHHNLVSDCVFPAPGDTTSHQCFTNDNDGLWTSIYLASESFRYAVTGSKVAYDNAVRTYEAMEMLSTVTPIPGFVARSFVSIDEPTGQGGEWHVSADDKWKWKGDTSSDELVGHMFAYPIFYELVANGILKERVKRHVEKIMSNIVDNNFQLRDLDGIATRWAVWTPDSLNNSPEWLYEKGINSLQILSFLESAYFVTKNPRFEKACQSLIKDHHYVDNMMQQKMVTPLEINHSDDELSYLPYYCLLRYVRDPQLKIAYQKSILRSWKFEKEDKNPLWNIISSASLNTDCDLQTALSELRNYPMETIIWGVQNHQRWDLRINPIADRFLKDQSTTVIPVAERGITKWNTNPYQFDYGGNGTTEDDGAAWLLPYWMGRYHQLFREQ